jgi:hypothetical protein
MQIVIAESVSLLTQSIDALQFAQRETLVRLTNLNRKTSWPGSLVFLCADVSGDEGAGAFGWALN